MDFNPDRLVFDVKKTKPYTVVDVSYIHELGPFDMKSPLIFQTKKPVQFGIPKSKIEFKGPILNPGLDFLKPFEYLIPKISK